MTIKWQIQSTLKIHQIMQRQSLTLLFLSLFLWHCASKAPENEFPELESALLAELENAQGDFAIAFKTLDDPSQMVLINEKEVFHAASTMKVPVMIEMYKQAGQGKFSMKDSIPIINEFRSIVDSSLFSMDLGVDSQENLYERIGQQATYYELMYEMVTMSSNLATNILIEKIGADNINATMREMGVLDNQVLRGVEDLKAFDAGLNNTTTAYDLMLIMEAIAKGETVDSASSEEMMDILIDQKFNEMIPELLPKDVVVAHKTGAISGVEHDAAIVKLPDGRAYVLVILSKNLEDVEKGKSQIAQISKIIYEYVISTDK
ncbi:hypothetical protein P872_12995 [Rhodonellum psychrophilum GCM71 = DSM 17998]|uniref:beta-lactamase n=2 Tax=Rhodonellum TaxID=336827 RepID=U5BJI8_9BACT|nr:hypothetical protein P872_12995 [Rhodonellum psychrophilum GCM71 = DSM 17998]